MPIELWFPTTKKGGLNKAEREQRQDDERLVKETCEQCEQRIPCLEYSLRHEPFGTWGGVSEIERAVMRNERGIRMVTISLEATQ
jgi:hypothetical protein